jgi:hypothetical protein
MALWQAGAEEWVSLFLLLLLALVFRAGSDRAWQMLRDRAADTRLPIRAGDPDNDSVALAGSASLDAAKGSGLPEKRSGSGER